MHITNHEFDLLLIMLVILGFGISSIDRSVARLHDDIDVIRKRVAPLPGEQEAQLYAEAFHIREKSR